MAPGPGRGSLPIRQNKARLAQRRGHVATGDAQGEALDHGGLADARLAGEDRVVLTATHEHVDDLADAAIHLMEHYSEATTINVGVGKDVTIKELVAIICDVVGFKGELEFDTSRPDGTPQKMLDIARLRSIGWTPNFELRDGLATTYAWFLENIDQLRAAG